MTVRVFIPCDAAALSMGANDVAAVIAEKGGDNVEIIRNGSRGMLWLEPMVEVLFLKRTSQTCLNLISSAAANIR